MSNPVTGLSKDEIGLLPQNLDDMRAAGILLKPFGIDELLRQVEQVLGRMRVKCATLVFLQLMTSQS